MDKSYNPTEIEARWQAFWQEHDFHAPAGEGEPYTIMLPPPNVTGRLHMGHAFQDTIMDALSRYHRMSGRRVLWQCGTDHAGIATQMVVERQLAAKGIKRHDLGRDKFVEAVWNHKEDSGGTIKQQMQRLGASVDWSTERFTMDEGLSAAVRKVFVQLFDEDLIYRGKRLVNWDPVLNTAVSDLEVVSAEENGSMWHLRYPREDGNGHLVVATTRPETMLGDTAVAVNPNDERYQDLIGQQVTLPLTGRCIPVIADRYVDPEFGTGCVKITPGHDFNDNEMGKRHDLPVINILNKDASLNDEVPAAYRGLDRFEARKQVVADLESEGLLEKIEPHTLMVPRGDRTGAVLEPLLTDQWFVRATPLAEPAIEAVRDGRIRFVPENWDKTYFEWMNNIQDWCISRQLWWGHRIPAWYDDAGTIYVGDDEAAVREKYAIDASVSLRQDEDVLDTWFSSALWPFSTLGWPENTDRLNTHYPTNVLVTGFDIIFFWVARMIMMGLKFMGDVPFRQVYIHGLIRDSHGQKMSKSKGNTLDPLDLIDGIELEPLLEKRTTSLMQPELAPKIIEHTKQDFPDGIQSFGTDALRFTFASLATLGRDIRFDTGRIEGNRNFCNKLWNAARFVLMNCQDKPLESSEEFRTPFDRWILSRLNHTVETVHEAMGAFRLDLASQAIYEFIWHEYCDWYLELSKVSLNSGTEQEQAATRYTLLSVLEETLRLTHPIMPFITEEIWQTVATTIGKTTDSIALAPCPGVDPSRQDADIEDDVHWCQQFILGVRQIRGEYDISPGKPLNVHLLSVQDSDREREKRFRTSLMGLSRLESLSWVGDESELPESAVALVGELKINIPLKGLIDPAAEIARLEKERDKHDVFIKRARGKLSNPGFVDKAPAQVVEKEREKLAAAEQLREGIDAQIQRLSAL